MGFPTRSLATLLMMAGVATCSDTPIAAVKTGSGPSAARFGRIALVPSFSKSAQYAASHLSDFPGLRFDSVRVVLRRVPGNELFRDTTVAFTPESAELSLQLNVDLGRDGRQFDATMEYRRSDGVVMYSGHQRVDAYAPNEPIPVPQPILIAFVGPGAGAKSISVSPKTLSLSGTQAVPLSVTAVDSSNNPIAVPYLAWQTSDDAVVGVSPSGLAQGRNRRGSATVTVTTPSGVRDAASVSVTLPPTAVSVVSGGGQSGKVGSSLANPAVVQVSAVDGVGVAGVSVIFSAPAGGSVSPTTAMTDANGRASTSMKLGTAAGPQGFAVVAAGFSAGINATATPGDPANVAVVSGGSQADTIRAALAPLIVRVTDSFGNPVSGASVSWSKSGAGALGAATSTTGTDGQTSNSYTLGGTLGAESVTATAGTGSASFNFTVTGGSPATIVAVSGGGQSARVGQPMASPFVVKVADAAGNPVRSAAIAWTGENVTIGGTSPSDASGQSSATATAGSSAGAGAVIASIVNGQRVTFPVMILASAPSAATFSPGPSSVVAGQVLPPVRVLLRDDTSNPAEGVVTLVIANNPSGAVLEGTLTQNTVSGVATFSNLRITRAGTGYTLRASTAGAVSVTSTPFNVTAGTAATMTVAAGNAATATVNTAVATPPSVKLVDGANNPIVGASVTFTPSAGSGSVVPASGVVATDAQGFATLTTWVLGTTVGAQALTVTSPGVQSLTFTATATPGNAFKLVLKNKASLQTSVLSGATLSPQPTIQVTDEFGNAVPAGQMQVTASLSTTGDPVLGGTASLPLGVTNGSATFTDLQLTGAGATRLVFNEGSGQIKPDTSNAISLTVGPAVSLRLVPSSQTAFTFTAGQVVTLPQVKAVDAQGNGVAGLTIRAEVDSGTGPGAVVIGANNFVTDALGLVSLTQPPATTAGIYRLIVTSAGIPDTLTLTATVNAGPAYKVVCANRAALQTTIKSDSALSPQPRIQVVDQYGNAVAMSGVSVLLSTAPSSGFSIGGTATRTLSASGGETYSGISVNGSGAMRLVVTATSGGSLAPDSSNTITVAPPAAGVASRMVASGTSDFGSLAAGSSIAAPPAVIVTDANGSAVPNIDVVFTVSANSGSVVGTRLVDTARTNGSGIARMSAWTLRTSIGPNTVTAQSLASSLSGTTVTFAATTVAGSLASLEFVNGHGVPPAGFENNAGYGNGLRLRAADAFNNPISGVIIDATTENSVLPSANVRPPGPAAGLALFAQPPKFVTDTSATTGTDGVADFGGVKFRGQAQSFGLRFTARGTGISAPISTRLRHGAGVNAICTATLPGRVRPGHRLSASPKFKIFDIDSNVVDNSFVALTATAGAISSASGTTDANGEVSVSTWDVRGSAGEDSVKVNGASGACHVRAANAHHLKLSVPSLARQKNGRLIPSIDATVVDAEDTALEDETFSIVAEAKPEHGKSISINKTKPSNNRGRTTFDSLMVDGDAQTGAYLKFSSLVGDLTLLDSLSFDVENGEPEALDSASVLSARGPGDSLQAGTFQVQVKDHGKHNNLNSATNIVKWTIGTETACRSVSFSSAATTAETSAISGIASSPTFYIASTLTANCTVTASAPSLTSVTFTITP